MKFLLKALLSFFALTITFLGSFAQSISGTFEGALDVNGVKLDMRIVLDMEEGKDLSGTLDIPMQGIKGMALSDLKLKDTKLKFKLPEVPGDAAYEGKFNNDFSAVEGTFTQGGMELPLAFVKMDDAILQAKVEDIKQLIDSIRIKQNIPAIGVGIVKNGKVILAEGFGERDINQGLKADANTLFAIGSSSKAFTTMGIGLLVDDGKMDWEMPIRHYMPDFELMDDFASEEMNAIDLVTHRSGLPRHDFMWYGTELTRSDLFNKLRHLEPSEPFRTKWQYNNLMFMTAGILIEDISDMSWEDYTKSKIFEPLGMTNSLTSIKGMENSDNTALGYRMIDDEVTYAPYRNIDAVGPAGSINSSVNDMVKWVQLHLGHGKIDGKEIINSDQIKLMHEPHMVIRRGSTASPEIQGMSYGLGWFTRVYDGHYVVHHGGNIDGFSALVFMVPDKDIGMVILTNMNGTTVPAILANSITDRLLDLEERDWYKRVYGEENDDEKEDKKEEDEPAKPRVEGTSPTQALKEYVGTYQHDGYPEVTITLKGDKLHFDSAPFSGTLEHWHYDLFKSDVEIMGEMEMYFVTDKNGEIIGLKRTMDPTVADIMYDKLPPDNLNDPDFLIILAGEYDLQGQTVKIDIQSGKLVAILPGQPTYTLLPFRDNTFNIDGLNGYSVAFELNKKGTASKGLKFIQPNGVFEATRIK